MREWIRGRNPVFESLKADRRHAFRLALADGAQEKGVLTKIVHTCRARKIPVVRLPRQELERFGPGHQGVALEVSGYPYADRSRILKALEEADTPPFLLLLDALQDPQNLGTLLRTAEAVGVHGVFIPPRRAVMVTPAVVSASSGASEHLLIATSNLAQMIETLKESNIWVIGLDQSKRAIPPDEIDLSGPVAVVVGNEGMGMRRLVRDSCDQLVQLPMKGRIGSLNASVAGSVALYLIWQARGFL